MLGSKVPSTALAQRGYAFRCKGFATQGLAQQRHCVAQSSRARPRLCAAKYCDAAASRGATLLHEAAARRSKAMCRRICTT